ncbi:MAG: hypothetical protein H0U59_05225 [Gemmatimonadaceae bacterium]|nr:hypothetical protein [Gemmatimonadaceae bacterium]
MNNQASQVNNASTIKALQLALTEVCLRMNLASAKPESMEHHMGEAVLAIMHLGMFDPTINQAVAILDPWGGRPDNPKDFDSCDVEGIARMERAIRVEIRDLVSPGTAPALALNQARVAWPRAGQAAPRRAP